MSEPHSDMFSFSTVSLPAADDVLRATVDPAFLRVPEAHRDVPTHLDQPEAVAALSTVQSRSLTGRQIDGIIRSKLTKELGTKWLMAGQECWYRPPRPPEATPRVGPSTAQTASSALDLAVLMVDNRPPLPYAVPGTRIRSPSGWGHPRVALSSTWTPPSSVGVFQIALVINHIWAQLHGYRFYLENPCPSLEHGVTESTWRLALHTDVLQRKPFTRRYAKYHATDLICPLLNASHRLGPFPPRGPPWAKLAAIRYVLRRHAYLAYLDSDCYVTEVCQLHLLLLLHENESEHSLGRSRRGNAPDARGLRPRGMPDWPPCAGVAADRAAARSRRHARRPVDRRGRGVPAAETAP